MAKQSRFEKIAEKKSEKNIALILLGTIIIITLLFFYGIPLLVNFSLFVMNLNKGGEDQVIAQNNSYLVAPVLDPLPDATNSARLNISGKAVSAKKVKLYLDDKYLDQADTDKEQNFIFKNISLKPGSNTIKISSLNDENKESDYSQPSIVNYINEPPDIQIESPQDGQSFSGSKQIKISGKSDPNARITINNYWAIVDNEGNFSYLLNLQKGENKIKITAIDEAGNQNNKEIKVTFDQ